MWKLLVGFAIFAALAIFFLSRGGDIDMGGEKHEVAHEAAPASAPAASAAASAELPMAASAASAASN